MHKQKYNKHRFTNTHRIEQVRHHKIVIASQTNTGQRGHFKPEERLGGRYRGRGLRAQTGLLLTSLPGTGKPQVPGTSTNAPIKHITCNINIWAYKLVLELVLMPSLWLDECV